MRCDRKDASKDAGMLRGPLRRKGYDWWWHSFTGVNEDSGEEKSFFIEFFTCNPALAGEKPTFGQLPENQAKGVRPSYLMVKAGCWGKDHCQLHSFFPWKEVRMRKEAPYYIQAGGCFASETRLFGSVSVSEEEAKAHPEWMSDSGQMQFDLTIDKQKAFNVGYGTSRPLRAMQAFEMYWHAQGMKSTYHGMVIYNGKVYRVRPEGSYGYADKNWGRDFTSPWVWLSSDHLVSNRTGQELSNSVFALGGGRPKIYGVGLNRVLLGAFYYEGAVYEFNFSKFWTGAKSSFSCRETEKEVQWHVLLKNRKMLMETDVRCKKEEMVLMNYEAPDGKKKLNRLWNGGTGTGRIRLYKKGPDGFALVDDISADHVGCEYGES